jgi:tagatose-1,6-bisphosphate aldolase
MIRAQSAASAGKRRGLEATSTTQHHFTILAIDHIGSLAQTMQPDNPGVVTTDQMVAAKTEIVRGLSHLCSAVLLDPLTGHQGRSESPPGETGLVLGIENGDDPSAGPQLRDGWSVPRAAASGADAVKISFRFDPIGDTSAVERFVAQVAAECGRLGLPLFAEPLGVVRSPDERRRVTVEAARRFGTLGVDVLKLEFPEDVSIVSDTAVWSEACAEIDAACAVPWTLLSAGEEFERFARMLEVACDHGASGFVVGRAVWQEAVSGGSVDQRWMETAAARLRRLALITRERARPWSAVGVLPGHNAKEKS